MAGRWEFPGGKREASETEAEALRRELSEELGVTVQAAQLVMRLVHDYPERRVELSMWRVERYAGAPRPLDGQQLKWVEPLALGDEDILEADRPFIQALQEQQQQQEQPLPRAAPSGR
jgi:8-oxo-dGTP diphosphatase